MQKIVNVRSNFKSSKVAPVNQQEKSVQNQIELFVEKRSSVGLQQLEASLTSFSANSKDLAKKGLQNGAFKSLEGAIAQGRHLASKRVGAITLLLAGERMSPNPLLMYNANVKYSENADR